jgi:hypothetical protein
MVDPGLHFPEIHRHPRIPAEDEVLITLDAARICRAMALTIKKRKQLHYLMNVKECRHHIRAVVFTIIALYP